MTMLFIAIFSPLIFLILLFTCVFMADNAIRRKDKTMMKLWGFFAVALFLLLLGGAWVARGVVLSF